MVAPDLGMEMVAKTILRFVNFGITILAIMLIWEIMRFVGGGKTAEGKHDIQNWKQSPLGGYIQKHQRRGKTRLLNEYLEEQKETNLLHDAKKTAEYALTAVDLVKKEGEIKNTAVRDHVVRVVKELEEKLKAAKQEYKRLSRSTWRQEREMGPILKKMREEGTNVNDLITNERMILQGHDACARIIDGVLGHYDDVKGPVKKLVDIKDNEFPHALKANPDSERAINELETNLKNDVYQLQAAFDKQTEVDTQVQGIISQAKQLWS